MAMYIGSSCYHLMVWSNNIDDSVSLWELCGIDAALDAIYHIAIDEATHGRNTHTSHEYCG